MEEVTLKEILNVVLKVKQELTEFKQETNQKFEEMKQEIEKMNERITTLEEGQKTMQKQINTILREQADTREIVKIIVDKIGKIDKKLDAQAKDKCMFHKTLVGAKS